MIWRIALSFDRPARLLLVATFAIVLADTFLRAQLRELARILDELDQ